MKKAMSLLLALGMACTAFAPCALAEETPPDAPVLQAIESTPETPETAVEPVEAQAQQPTETENTALETANAVDVPLDAAHFPDENFRAKLTENDTDKDGILSAEECAAVENLYLNSKSIKDLTGIEYFTNLESLSCVENQLTSLDVSKNTALTHLDCSENKLAALDISKNTALKVLTCYKNQLTALDVSKNTALTSLWCNDNVLTTLDVSTQSLLDNLRCDNNKLTVLDLSKNAVLASLMCNNNALTTLDVSKQSTLRELICTGNQLTSLDVSKNTALESFNCAKNQLATLDVSKNAALRIFYCHSNQLTALDVSKNINLTELGCGSNQLTTLDVSKNTGLESLYCDGNRLAVLDLTSNAKLEDVQSYGVQEIEAVQTCVNDVWQLPLSDLPGVTVDRITLRKASGNRYPYIENGVVYIGSKTVQSSFSYTYHTTDSTTEKLMTVVVKLKNATSATPTPTPTLEPTKETGVGGFVTRLYQVCLSRNPDAAGKADWENNLKTGKNTGVQAAYGFIFSNEFKGKNLCNTDYVKQLYQAFMGRQYDAPGLKDWVNQLGSGKTREEVFNGFALSQEFKKICDSYGITQGEGIAKPEYGTVPTGACSVCGAQDGVTGFVTRMYKVALGRTPDAAGLKDWTNNLWSHKNSGTDIGRGFIFSNEFKGKNYNNADYVEHLYEAFMGRGSDPAGKADWVGQLDKGTGREQVFNGFANSVEFDKICKSYGIKR